MQTALFIFLLCIMGSFIQRTTGFGFGIFVMTMLPMLMPSYGEATTLSGLFAMTTSLVVAFRMRRLICWRRIIPILLAFTVTAVVSIFCVSKIEDHLLRRILGVVLIAVSLWFALLSKRIRLRPNMPTQITTGLLSGLMGGFFAMQGPPAVLYYIASEPDKDHYMADIQMYFVLGNTLMTITRGFHGFLTPTVGMDYIYGIVGVAIGASLGAFVFNKIPGRIFQYIVYGYIGVAGVMTLVTA